MLDEEEGQKQSEPEKKGKASAASGNVFSNFDTAAFKPDEEEGQEKGEKEFGNDQFFGFSGGDQKKESNFDSDADFFKGSDGFFGFGEKEAQSTKEQRKADGFEGSNDAFFSDFGKPSSSRSKEETKERKSSGELQNLKAKKTFSFKAPEGEHEEEESAQHHESKGDVSPNFSKDQSTKPARQEGGSSAFGFGDFDTKHQQSDHQQEDENNWVKKPQGSSQISWAPNDEAAKGDKSYSERDQPQGQQVGALNKFTEQRNTEVTKPESDYQHFVQTGTPDHGNSRRPSTDRALEYMLRQPPSANQLNVPV